MPIAFCAEQSVSVHVHSDDGHGIPPEYLENVFEPCCTAPRQRGGMGLGIFSRLMLMAKFMINQAADPSADSSANRRANRP